jgi:S-DNA-T family DNA segregation ATPase FtsK/SpoIIIE
MRTTRTGFSPSEALPELLRSFALRRAAEGIGLALCILVVAVAIALITWRAGDPSLNHAVDRPIKNWLGAPGAVVADTFMQLLGIAAIALLLTPLAWGWRLVRKQPLDRPFTRVLAWLVGVACAAAVASALPRTDRWPLPSGLGGAVGDMVLALPEAVLGSGGGWMIFGSAAAFGLLALSCLHFAAKRANGTEDDDDLREPVRGARRPADEDDEPSLALVILGALIHSVIVLKSALKRRLRSFQQGSGSTIARGTRAFVERVTTDDSLAVAGHPGRAAPRGDERLAPAQRDDLMMYRRQRATEPEVAPRPAAPAERREPTLQPPADPVPRYGLARLTDALGVTSPAKPVAAVSEPAIVPPASPFTRRSWEPSFVRKPRADQRIEPSFDPLEPAPDDESAIEIAVQSPPADATPEPLKPLPLKGTAQSPPPVPAAAPAPFEPDVAPRVTESVAAIRPGRRELREAQPSFLDQGSYQLPPVALLSEPKRIPGNVISADSLEQNARLLEGVLDDFGVRGEIINVRPGPVVTLYELEPAPGTKSARVIGLADDIARSMSAISTRVAVVPGRNVIGIELPNQRRETVYFRELIGSEDYEKTKLRLALCLGKTIGGEPVITELAKMPHLLVAGTTGSGKSVAINTMILSLLYRLKPEECRLIMIDPKMLELSVYEGIPHLLTPVVTDPKKAVVALKWAVREMEDRYKKMSRVGVRNIDGFNARLAEARASGEVLTRTVQTGFDKDTGEVVEQLEEMQLDPLPYIVVIIDEMADLMMVAGKDIEGAVQRLAQMARAAGIHVIMATQRPSVDVITGTIKANFPTRISFQVTSKIDSRTILGEQGAEQLLGQGDMLYMAGGGRITRVHGPFVSDEEVERIVAHLKTQGRPQYLDAITADEDETPGDNTEGAVFDKGSFGDEGADLYDQAVKVVLRDKKASTSYIQRRLQIGYNRAASLMERMEREGVVGAANHAGKREILMETRSTGMDDDEA